MKTKTTIYLLFAVLLFITSCSKDDTDIPSHDEIQSRIQELVENEFEKYREKVPDYPGGIALKVISGSESFFVSAGMESPVTDQIHFRAASNTKTFTSAAILLLHQQGKLNINHCITDNIPGTSEPYVPNTPGYAIPYKSSITILDLLRHRAGVFDISNEYIPDTISAQVPYKGLNYIEYVDETDASHTFTFDELINVVAETGVFYFAPGTKYHYSNTGYSILGKIIERVSKKSYQNYLMENIITPMGLQNTSMPVLGTDQTIPEPFVPGYVLYGGEEINVTQSNISANVAEGNLITTPEDLANFLRKLLSGQGILGTHIVNSVMMNCLPTSTSSAGGYGCGLQYTNNLGYGHSGAHEGYLSIMAFDPDNDMTFVAFTNVWNLNDEMNSLVIQLTDLLEASCYKTKTLLISSR